MLEVYLGGPGWATARVAFRWAGLRAPAGCAGFCIPSYAPLALLDSASLTGSGDPNKHLALAAPAEMALDKAPAAAGSQCRLPPPKEEIVISWTETCDNVYPWDVGCSER